MNENVRDWKQIMDLINVRHKKVGNSWEFLRLESSFLFIALFGCACDTMDPQQRVKMDSQAIQRTIPSEGLSFERSIKEQVKKYAQFLLNF